MLTNWPAELPIIKFRLFDPPDAIYCAAPDVDWKYNLLPAADAVPKVTLPFESMRSDSPPAV